jgi:hypothetical protein
VALARDTLTKQIRHLSRPRLRDFLAGSPIPPREAKHVQNCTVCKTELSIALGRGTEATEIAARAIGGLRSGFESKDPWPATFILGAAVRLALRRNVRLDGILTLINSLMWELQQLTARRMKREPTLDNLHPTIEALEVLVSALAGCPEMAAEFERGFERMIRKGGPTTRVGLTYTLAELDERGEKSKEMTQRLIRRMSRMDDPKVRATLGLLVALRPEIAGHKKGTEVPVVLGSLGLVDQNDNVAGVQAQAGRVAKAAAAGARRGSMDEVKAAYAGLAAMLYSDKAPEAVRGIVVFRLATKVFKKTPKISKNAQERFATHICDQLFAPLIKDTALPIFASVEAAEGIRDWCPSACASFMGDRYPAASKKLQTAFGVCIAEGYEEKFAGLFQSKGVPYFAGGGFIGVVDPLDGVRNPLNVFGELIANVAEFSRKTWWNDRLTAWLPPRGPGASRFSRPGSLVAARSDESTQA